MLKIDLSWAQELCIIMFVWMAKFGAAYGVRTGIHVGVDVLINRLDDRNRFKFIVFGLLAGALFTGIVATLGATLRLGERRALRVLQALRRSTSTTCSRARTRRTSSGRRGWSIRPFRSARR